MRRMIWRTLADRNDCSARDGRGREARADDCPRQSRRPLGVSRVISIDPRDFTRVGTVQQQ